MEAVQKAMWEELGIPKDTCFPEEIFSFTYYSAYDGLSEYEFDHVLLCDYYGAMKPNPEEMTESKWIALTELQTEMQAHPERFSTWFLIAAPKVMAYIQERR